MDDAQQQPRPELLQKRPEARAFKLEDLLDEVRQGRLRIPEFQRPFKWQRDDAMKLLDSIYRGYPVGTLLFWEAHAGPTSMSFGSVKLDAGERPDALWVVDGQQRIVSLVRTLLAPEPEIDGFAAYFDLDEQSFVLPPSNQARQGDPARWLPATVLLDSEQLIHWLLANVSTTERRERAVQLGKRIREYDIPAYIVRAEREAVLREIFSRSNTRGKSMEASEVFDALHGSRSKSRPASLSQIVTGLEDLGFGRVEDKIVYRLLRVLHGQDVTDRSGEGILRLGEAESSAAYVLTEKVARSVLLFLKRDVGIPHYDLLPYKQPIVTLGKFFLHHPVPSPRSRELLVRWIWRGALNGSHRGDTVSTRRALERIDATDEAASVRRMLEQVSQRPDTYPDAKSPFNFRHAAGKLQALALIDRRPRDLASGTVLDTSELFAASDGEPPLPSIITSAVEQDSGLLHSVANRLVHPHRAGLRRTIRAGLSEEILTSHLMEIDDVMALAVGKPGDFLAGRARSLSRHFRHFFDAKARWDESDRPALASLVISEED